MKSRSLLNAAWALSVAALANSQDTAPGLNSYIGLVQSAAGAVKSANSAATASSTPSSSSSSASPSSPTAAAPASTATQPPARQGSNNKTLIIAVVCAVVGAILIGLIILALCLCLARRRKRRNRHVRTPSPISEHEPKSWKVNQPNNPGRTYAPISSQTSVPSMAHESAVSKTTHHGGPMVEQHPAYRPENPFVPVPPSPRKTHHQPSPSYDTDATLAPYATMTADPEKQPLAPRVRDDSIHRPSTGSSSLPTHTGPDRPPTPFGLMGAGATGAAVGAAAVGAAKHDDHHSEPVTSHRRSHERMNPPGVGHQVMSGPTSHSTQSSGYTGPTGLNQHRTSGQQQHFDPPSVTTPMTQSINSPGVTGGTATTRASRSPSGHPYTSIGEPYNDMHVHVLQNSAPSRNLQHSPPPVTTVNTDAGATARRTSLPGPYSTPYVPPASIGATIPRYATPPEVPSRSPRRLSHQNTSDSSYEGEPYDSTTASSSDNGWHPSYAPAVSNEQDSSPHSSMQRHTPRSSNGTTTSHPRNSNGHNVHFSNSPTAAATPVGPPPPVPWDTEDRRYSPQGSPRASGSYDRNSGQYERTRRDSQGNHGYGRRTSHSPATSINGQPRRLRFSDLQATEHSREWETQRFGGGVGEAL